MVPTINSYHLAQHIPGAQLIVYQSATSTFQGTWGPDQQGSLAAIGFEHLEAGNTGRSDAGNGWVVC